MPTFGSSSPRARALSVASSAVKRKFFALDKDRSGDLDGREAVALAEVIIKSAVDKVEDTKTEWEAAKMADKMYVY